MTQGIDPIEKKKLIYGQTYKIFEKPQQKND
jgi:hypothetical protein